MAERRKGKKKKDIVSKDLDKTPTKEEYAIARYLKQKLPEKKTTLLGHKVEYFIASKAVDCLLESQWAKNTKKGEIHFNNRDAVMHFMARMLEQKLFHRAKKIIVQKDQKKKKGEEDVESGKEKESKKSKSKSETSEKKEDKDGKKEGEGEKKKEKKKIKLDMHLEQIFVDSNEPYVWIYDPIPIRTWITGALMVVAAVLICLFPLWPQTIRHYIYYLSVAVAFFLVFIIGLAVFRLIFFVLVWILTLGRHHIWLLPNLTEDVGFFESFWPLYKYEYKGKTKKESEKEEDESDDKHKDNKNEDDSSKKEGEEDKDGEKSDASSSDQERKTDQNHSDSEESSGGEKQKENENGFEIIEAEDAEDETKTEDDEDRKTK